MLRGKVSEKLLKPAGKPLCAILLVPSKKTNFPS